MLGLRYMNKTLGILFVLTLIPSLAFAALNSLPEGCEPGYNYSILTGKRCVEEPAECLPGHIYSIFTGRRCDEKRLLSKIDELEEKIDRIETNTKSQTSTTIPAVNSTEPYQIRASIGGFWEHIADAKNPLSGFHVQIIGNKSTDTVEVKVNDGAIPLDKKEDGIYYYRVPIEDAVYDVDVTVNGVTKRGLAKVSTAIDRNSDLPGKVFTSEISFWVK